MYPVPLVAPGAFSFDLAATSTGNVCGVMVFKGSLGSLGLADGTSAAAMDSSAASEYIAGNWNYEEKFKFPVKYLQVMATIKNKAIIKRILFIYYLKIDEFSRKLLSFLEFFKNFWRKCEFSWKVFQGLLFELSIWVFSTWRKLHTFWCLWEFFETGWSGMGFFLLNLTLVDCQINFSDIYVSSDHNNVKEMGSLRHNRDIL